MEPLVVGGTAEVWRCVDERGRSFALKVLKTGLERRTHGAHWFAREHAWLRRLRHPSIIETFGMGEYRGRPALVLEYLGGGDLASLAGLPPRYWIEAARAVVDALRHVHDVGLVHRDVKLRNVLFDAGNRAVLADFGSAARHGAAVPAGGVTAEYRCDEPPARRAERREDRFALAVMLHELLYGRLPPRLVAVAGRPAAAVPDDEPMGALARTVGETLVRRGGGPRLSDFADVLKSVAAALAP